MKIAEKIYLVQMLHRPLSALPSKIFFFSKNEIIRRIILLSTLVYKIQAQNIMAHKRIKKYY